MNAHIARGNDRPHPAVPASPASCAGEAGALLFARRVRVRYFRPVQSDAVSVAKRRRRAALVVVAFLLLAAIPSPAAEIHSNGVGGGLWSDPATWHGKTLPATNDNVIIRGDDMVEVDLIDTQKVACADLYLDPRSALSFKSGKGHVMLAVNGMIESYGAIRMEMSESETDIAELRLVSVTPEKRLLRLMRGGSALLNGREGLPDGRKNVIVASMPSMVDTNYAADIVGMFEAMDRSSLDINQAAIRDVRVMARELDNTGATAGERVNILNSLVTGRGQLYLYVCDTGLVAGNTLITTNTSAWGGAIRFESCALGEIRDNRISGPFDYGIVMAGQTDGAMIGNRVENNPHAIYYTGPNAMLRNNVITNCLQGITMASATGVIEGSVIDGSTVALSANAGRVQFKDVQIITATNAPGRIALQNATLTLLNSLVTTNAWELTDPPPTDPKTGPLPWIISKHYLIARVTGSVPAGSQVVVEPAAQVHNTPATIGPGGWTPLPQTLNPLILTAWQVGHNKAFAPAAAHKLKVLGPAPAPNTPQPVLKEMDVTPSDAWYRPKPDELKATVEVTVP